MTISEKFPVIFQTEFVRRHVENRIDPYLFLIQNNDEKTPLHIITFYSSHFMNFLKKVFMEIDIRQIFRIQDNYGNRKQ